MSLLAVEECLLVEIDLQEKFVPIVWKMDTVIENTNKLIAAANLVSIPLIASEQYPEGLGKTTDRVNLPDDVEPFRKVHFNCFLDEKFHEAVSQYGRKQLIVCGIETHVCVCQSVLSALAIGYEVHVVADAVSSRTEQDRSIGLERMKQSGAFIASTEMLLFQMMEQSKDPRFPELSRIVKG